MGIGSRKSRTKVSRKEEMHASLKALRREDGGSSVLLEVGKAFSASSSEGVVVGDGGAVLLSFS